MKTTLNLDDELVSSAMELTGITEKTALIHEGLKALLEKSARERLIRLAGSRKEIKTTPRRRRSS